RVVAGHVPRCVGRGSLARRAGISGDQREESGARDARLRAGLLEAGEGGPQVLVARAELRLEPVELLVLEHGPPGAAWPAVGGRGELPVAELLVGQRGWSGRRSLITGSERAT